MQFLSSISGLPISAASAGYAPTNGADVSAIASAYADPKLDATASSSFYPADNPSGFITGVDLTNYATTGYVDSSVSSKLDTTAFSDVSGNFLTAVPEEYATTAYVDSSVSGKLDASASSSFYTTANESGYVDSAYVDSAVSGKQDTLTFAYDSDSAISSINGSALAGGGGGAAIPFTGYYYDSATSATETITADVTAVSSLSYAKHDGTVVNAYKGITDSLGIHHLGVASFIDVGAEINNLKSNYTLAFAPVASMWTTADVATGIFAPLQYGTGAGMFLDNGSFKGYLKGNEWFVANTAYGYARGEVHQNRGCRVIIEHTGGAGAVLSAKGKTADVSLTSTAYSTAHMSVSGNHAYVQVKRGNSASKYNSAKLDTDYLQFYNGMSTGYLDPEDTASGTAYLPDETEYIYISSIPYWNGKADSSSLADYQPTSSMSAYASTADLSAKLDASSIETSTAGITGIAGSAIAGGGGGGGTTYTAGQYIQISGNEISVTGINPGDYQTTAGMSGYATTGDLAQKLDTTSVLTAEIDFYGYPEYYTTAIRVSSQNCPILATRAMFADMASSWTDASSKLDVSASSSFMPASASSSFITSTANCQPSGNYVSSSELADYQTTAGMSGYATTAALSAKLDASASSAFITSTADCMPLSASAYFATTGDLSGKLDASASSSFITSTAGLVSTGDLSAYLETSAIETSTAGVTGIAGTAIAGGGEGADWSAESGQPGYIENKPVPKTLVAGAGITITENASSLSVAATNAAYSAGSGLTLSGTTFSVDTGVVAMQSDLSGYVPGTSPMIDTETFAGYWNGSAVYQKIVTGVISSNAASTAVASDTAYAGKQVWIDHSNSYMTYGSTSNLLPLNWYLGSARNGGFSFVGTGRPILYRGIDNSVTVCTAYICVKYIK